MSYKGVELDDKDLNIIKELLLKPIMEQLTEIKTDINRLYEISEKFSAIDKEIEKIKSEQVINKIQKENNISKLNDKIDEHEKRIKRLEEKPKQELKIWHLIIAIISSIVAIILSILRILKI